MLATRFAGKGMLAVLYDPGVKTVRIILRAYNAAFLMLTFFLSTLGF